MLELHGCCCGFEVGEFPYSGIMQSFTQKAGRDAPVTLTQVAYQIMRRQFRNWAVIIRFGPIFLGLAICGYLNLPYYVFPPEIYNQDPA